MQRSRIKKGRFLLSSEVLIKLFISSSLLLLGIFFILNLIAGSGFTILQHSYSKNDFRGYNPNKILKGQIRHLVIKSQFDNMGIISFRFNTYSKINHDILNFRIKEEGAKEWYSKSSYTTEQFQHNELFTVGFPVISNSSQRNYIVELESIRGTASDSVALSENLPNIVTKYKFSKNNIYADKLHLSKFIINKCFNFLSNEKNLILTLLYLSPFVLFFSKYILFRKKLQIGYVKSHFNKLSKLSDDFFLIKKNKAFPAFDGVRAWAIIMVYFAHTLPWLLSMSKEVTGTSKLFNDAIVVFFRYFPFIGIDGGGLGVDLFFVLSGFLIYMTLHKRQYTFKYFIGRRYMRLLPVHLVLIIGEITNLAFPIIFINIFFLTDLFPKVTNVNLPTWTLTYEIIFYFICAVWYILGRKIKTLHSWKFFIFFAILIYFSDLVMSSPLATYNIRYPEMTRFIAFFFGIALAKLYFGDQSIWNKTQVIFKHSGYVGLLIICILKYLWGTLILHKRLGDIGSSISYFMLDIGIILLIGSLLTEKQSYIKKVFSNKILRIIGIISYSIYLFHYNWGLYIGNMLVKEIYFTPIKMVVFVLSGFVVSVIMSIFLFHYLEKPYFTQRRK